MRVSLQSILRVAGAIAVLPAVLLLVVWSAPRSFSGPFAFNPGSLLEFVDVLIAGARVLWPFAMGAFVLERFILKRHAFWAALALGLGPTVWLGAAAATTGAIERSSYLAMGLMYLSPTLWALLGFFIGYVFRQTVAQKVERTLKQR